MKVPHLVISPPPPRRSAMSKPSSACVLTPPLVVIVTSLLPTSQVILRPPAKRNSAMGDLREQKRSSWLLYPSIHASIFLCLSRIYNDGNSLHQFLKKKNNNIVLTKTSFQPLRQSREIGKNVSCHHVQTRLCELQVDGLQPFVCLSHRILISRAQTAGGCWGVHPTWGHREMVKAWQGEQKWKREEHKLQIYFNRHASRDIQSQGNAERHKKSFIHVHVSDYTTCNASICVYLYMHLYVCT